MTSVNLEEARVLIVDPQLHTRRMMKDALNMIGFRKMQDLGKVKKLEHTILRVEPDLILIDIDEERERVCEAISKIRNRKLGSNPFVNIIALTWKPDQEAIQAVLSAGTDDVVMKPVSGKILRDRVMNLIENRKEFVVTSDYVGPDRRSGEDREPSENDLPTIQVPNSLRYATTRDTDAAVDDDQIAETMRSLCAQKVYRLATDMSVIAGELMEHCEKLPDEALPEPEVGKIASMLNEIQELIAEHSFDSVNQISESTLGILEKIVASGAKADGRQVELLHLHGQAIAVTLRESDESAGALVNALNEAALAVSA